MHSFQFMMMIFCGFAVSKFYFSPTQCDDATCAPDDPLRPCCTLAAANQLSAYYPFRRYLLFPGRYSADGFFFVTAGQVNLKYM
jgi:hypothetical protein